MMKSLKTITFTLLIGLSLTFSGLAQTGDNWQRPKEKEKEQPRERDKPKGGDERGGGKKDEKKDKKPEFF